MRRTIAWTAGGVIALVGIAVLIPGPFIALAALIVIPTALLLKVHLERKNKDASQLLLEAAAKLTNGTQQDWGTAMRAELTTITDRSERRRFAVGSATALLGSPNYKRSVILSASTAVGFAAVLLAFARATVEQGGGLGTLSVLGPSAILFAIAFHSARTKSLRQGIETGVIAAVAVVFGVEAPRWFEAHHVYLIDRDYADIETVGAAVRDALHPVILAVHLFWWIPFAVLGAIVGARTKRSYTRQA